MPSINNLAHATNTADKIRIVYRKKHQESCGIKIKKKRKERVLYISTDTWITAWYYVRIKTKSNTVVWGCLHVI